MMWLRGLRCSSQINEVGLRLQELMSVCWDKFSCLYLLVVFDEPGICILADTRSSVSGMYC